MRRITTGLENPLSKLYLMFLSDALSLINTFNKTMQMHSPTVHVLYQEVLSFVKRLLLRFLSPGSLQGARISALDLHDTSQFLPLDKVFIGEKAKMFLTGDIELSTSEIRKFQETCRNFWLAAAT